MTGSVSQPDPHPWDLVVLKILQDRDGIATLIRRVDGQRDLLGFNITWGYDMGDEFSHITTNISPGVEGRSFALFFTSDVCSLVDPSNGVVLAYRNDEQ